MLRGITADIFKKYRIVEIPDNLPVDGKRPEGH